MRKSKQETGGTGWSEQRYPAPKRMHWLVRLGIVAAAVVAGLELLKYVALWIMVGVWWWACRGTSGSC